MIIGIDASRANHAEKTGVEWYAFFLIEELKKLQNADCRPASSAGGLQNLRFVLYSDEPLRGDLAVLPENWQAKVLTWSIKRFWSQIRLSWEMMMNPPDVLFIPAHVVPFIHPKKTVMTVHDVAAAKFPEGYNWFERWYSVWSAKYAVRNLWKIITPSEFTKSELLKIPPQSGEVRWGLGRSDWAVVIHHGYDTRYRKINDQSAIDAVLKKYNLTKPFFLSVGRLEEKKNTVNVIRAFNQFRINAKFKILNSKFQLVLIGRPGHGYEYVKEAIVQSPYKHDIKLLGWIPADDLVYIMNAAEAFVFTSLYEGFGLPVLEAFACGTPVIAGRGSSLEEVGDNAASYVDPTNIDEIAEAMQKILIDAELRSGLIAKGFERAKNFSWETAAKKTLEVLIED